jgi:hypothetical protein
MSLWNQQSHNVNEGDIIDIKNSQVKWFNGQRYLSLGRKGSLTVIEKDNLSSTLDIKN